MRTQGCPKSERVKTLRGGGLDLNSKSNNANVGEDLTKESVKRKRLYLMGQSIYHMRKDNIVKVEWFALQDLVSKKDIHISCFVMMTDARKYVEGDDQVENPGEKGKQRCKKFDLKGEIKIPNILLMGLDVVEGRRRRNSPRIKNVRSPSGYAKF